MNGMKTLETNLHPFEMLLSNDMDIITNNREYKINTRLMILMRRIVDMNVIKIIWSKIMGNMKKNIWISLHNEELTIILRK